MTEEILLIDNQDDLERLFSDGQIQLFQIGTRRIAVAKWHQEYFAFDNHCPHADYPLNQGKLSPSGAVVCRWHNYMFSLRSGKEAENRCKNLKTYPVALKADGALMLYL